jgi:hypothetical protein
MARIRSLVLLSAAVGLSGCAGIYGPGYGVSAGYGNNGYYDPYDPYGYAYGGGYGGYGRYGAYGSPYGGYGYGNPYGWYDGYYYPGSGYYVYDRSGARQQWNDAQRRYWEGRRVGSNPLIQDWVRRQEGATNVDGGGTTSGMSTRRVRVQSQPGVQSAMPQAESTRSYTDVRRERMEAQQERREARQERRESRREARQAPAPRVPQQED